MVKVETKCKTIIQFNSMQFNSIDISERVGLTAQVPIIKPEKRHKTQKRLNTQKHNTK
jgi:hypothetical protein